MDINTLKKIGLSERDVKVYLGLISTGPSSVRTLAKITELNRGVVYESLKTLRQQGLVNYYEKNTKQFFVAENPEKLRSLVQDKMRELTEVEKGLKEVVSELKSVYDRGGEKPVARYYENGEIREVLEDVLDTCEETGQMEYRVYSHADLREHLYEGFETFSDARVAKGIAVKAIAIGHGGELRGLDKRKWLKGKSSTPTYIIIYPGKTAYISLSTGGEPVGVVIENTGVYETQKDIFDELWEKL